MGWKVASRPEYATAQIAVWWDMNGCPIPDGYDACRVRPSIEGEFKKLGYSGPVSITAYGDHTQNPNHFLRELSSTGVAVAHTNSERRCSIMFSDMLEWRDHNPPPATMMLISDHVDDVFSWDLARLQQVTKYNFFRASTFTSHFISELETSAVWLWNELLLDDSKHEEIIYSCAMFYCKSCHLKTQRLHNFRKHLSSREHALDEMKSRKGPKLDPVTRKWGKNYTAMPEYATAKIAVWWDMYDCPIPKDYDARQVRPRLEEAFKKLGYSGPVSITAYGDTTQTPDHLLLELSSTGVTVAHTIPDVNYTRMYDHIMEWESLNPPPATLMIISDQLEKFFSKFLALRQQRTKYNIFLAYSFRPCKMSVLVTSAEWLWDCLLAVSETTRPLLERSESTGMFYCRSCYDFCDYKSLDNLRKHFLSKEHAVKEASILSRTQRIQSQREQWIEEDIPKSKRLRKSFPTGFRLLRNNLCLTNRGARRGVQKSQT